MMPSEEVLDSSADWVKRDIRRYVERDGKIGRRWNGENMLLLTTRGRRSGKLRRTALIYGRDGERLVVVASNGGKASHPFWYLNLVADPEVDVRLGPRSSRRELDRRLLVRGRVYGG